MPEAVKLSFDDGYKTVMFNNDPDKVIRINPTDAKFIHRISNADQIIDKIQKKYGDVDLNSVAELENLDPEDPDFDKVKKAVKNMEEFEKAIREFINELFEYDICSIVFGDDWCISPAGSATRYENFLECIMNYIEKESKDMASKARADRIKLEEKTAKYTSHLDKSPLTVSNPVNVYASPTNSNLPDVSSLTPEQKQALIAELSK